MNDDREFRWRHFWLALVFLGLLSSVQCSGILHFGRAGVAPDLVLVAVIAWAFLTDSSAGALWGFTGGLLLDSISATPFPLNTLIMTLIGTVIGAGRLNLYSDNALWSITSSVAGIMSFYLLFILALVLAGRKLPLFATMGYVVLPALVLDVALMLLFLPVLRLMHKQLFSSRSIDY